MSVAFKDLQQTIWQKIWKPLIQKETSLCDEHYCQPFVNLKLAKKEVSFINYLKVNISMLEKINQY